MARQIDGDIVQMSMTYWVKEVAAILHNRIAFSHSLLNMDGEKSIAYITKKNERY
ncbi:MAG: hypothetical protein Pg6A_18390 [Termitinemataceae bacterium]|nr:MAG: hypothetical protein Pg6A_18390 [Termitinemataceae bacterium]